MQPKDPLMPTGTVYNHSHWYSTRQFSVQVFLRNEIMNLFPPEITNIKTQIQLGN
jgi:hypothetical protein